MTVVILELLEAFLDSEFENPPPFGGTNGTIYSAAFENLSHPILPVGWLCVVSLY